MPTPFSELERPFKIPMEYFPYMNQKTVELLTMWIDCKNYGYKPSDFRENNRILQEDLRAFDMMNKLHDDGQKYQEALEKGHKENKEYIAKQKAEFQASKGHSHRR